MLGELVEKVKACDVNCYALTLSQFCKLQNNNNIMDAKTHMNKRKHRLQIVWPQEEADINGIFLSLADKEIKRVMVIDNRRKATVKNVGGIAH